MAKTVVITGASRGIGAETARKFAENGYNIVVNYLNNDEKGRILASELEKLGAKVLLIKSDVSTSLGAKEVIQKAIDVFGKIDVLVCNSGVAHYNLLIDEMDEEIDYVINNNLKSVIYLCREAGEHMIGNQAGKIVTVSSMWGLLGASNEVVYSASKGGVIAFTKALAKELGLSGINVNCVAPGTIMTDMVSNLDNQTLESLAEKTALNRLGNPRDVAEAIYFLASDNASYITGQVLSVDGLYE